MAGRAHCERETAAGEANLERLFDGEFLIALRSRAAMPFESAMFANFVAHNIGCLVVIANVRGIGFHPSPTSSESGTDSVAMYETARRTSGLSSSPPLAT